jgi:hypothetical protein
LVALPPAPPVALAIALYPTAVPTTFRIPDATATAWTDPFVVEVRVSWAFLLSVPPEHAPLSPLMFSPVGSSIVSTPEYRASTAASARVPGLYVIWTWKALPGEPKAV